MIVLNFNLGQFCIAGNLGQQGPLAKWVVPSLPPPCQISLSLYPPLVDLPQPTSPPALKLVPRECSFVPSPLPHLRTESADNSGLAGFLVLTPGRVHVYLT